MVSRTVRLRAILEVYIIQQLCSIIVLLVITNKETPCKQTNNRVVQQILDCDQFLFSSKTRGKNRNARATSPGIAYYVHDCSFTLCSFLPSSSRIFQQKRVYFLTHLASLSSIFSFFLSLAIFCASCNSILKKRCNKKQGVDFYKKTTTIMYKNNYNYV